MYPKVDEQQRVICQLCGKPFQNITIQHVRKIHNIDLVEYRNRFPDCPLVSERTKAKRKYAVKESYKENEDSIIIKTTDTNNPTIEPLTSSYIIEEPIVERFESEKERISMLREKFQKEGMVHHIHEDKFKIYMRLSSMYPTVFNNYMINITTMQGRIEFSTITDLAIPDKKIDFEFPNTFWHNRSSDMFPYRNDRIRENGWKIITISSRHPTFEEVLQAL